ncbi:MAG: FprA family A-type flavoprotein [Candidatus Izemoplasmatales bacterium]|nr:FprA family A-type flavoprotein [Candidatus Izemoplasmatales bacterium]
MQPNTFELTKNVYWVGVNDYDLRVFDITMATKYGTTYNAYLIKGSEKIALIDTTKANFGDEYIEKVKSLTDITKIDYLILNHTEPDHSGSVVRILDLNPDITIVASGPGLSNLKEIMNRPFKSIRAKDDLVISLGDKTLKFMIQPNLHWPDTIFTHLVEDSILFTCDFFGAHYAFEGVLAKNVRNRSEYIEALKHYFDSIMSPFKADVRRALDALSGHSFRYIATSHGAVLDETAIEEAKTLYLGWATETDEERKVVVIPYASAYGYTKKMAEEIFEGINQISDRKVVVKPYDVVTTPLFEIVSEIEKADAFLIGSTTILKDAPKPIWDILSSLNPEIHGGKLAGAFGSYGWSGEAVPNITDRLKQLKMRVQEGLRIRFNPSNSQCLDARKFGEAFAKELLGIK